MLIIIVSTKAMMLWINYAWERQRRSVVRESVINFSHFVKVSIGCVAIIEIATAKVLVSQKHLYSHFSYHATSHSF